MPLLTPSADPSPSRRWRSRAKFGAAGMVMMLLLTSCPGPNPPSPIRYCTLGASEWARIEDPKHSAARVWDELALNAIRNVLPQPTAHARNLFHLSVAMYDTWASYDPVAQGLYSREKHTGTPAQTTEALNYAAHRVLKARFEPILPSAAACFDDRLKHLGLNPTNTDTTGDTPAAIGNRIGQAVLDFGATDGANDANNYADTSGYATVNPPLQPELPGTTLSNPDRWQKLLLRQPFTQNGIPQPDGPQPFMGAHWQAVKPFAMHRTGKFYHDPGPIPSLSDPQMRNVWIPDLLSRQAALDTTSAATIDLSPSKMGNNPLGRNDGTGHPLNPVTGQPYAPNVVKLADYGRVIAEYWADGPRSETPPGHWNVMANEVSDDPKFVRKLGGTGPELSALEWDVKLYFALNGALHDAASSAWEIKRQTDTARPISLVRYLAGRPNDGLLLQDGVVRQPSDRYEVKEWLYGRVAWGDPLMWVPYQRSDFVSPAFPAFVSGHSTFSRAAAEVLTDLTGSEFFPGGLHEVAIPPDFIRIGYPSNPEALKLQWATYYDAADQSGVSRIWGGIHIQPDDFAGRRVGHQVGLDAVKLARQYFAGQVK